jgi:hypothetical protein
MTRRRSLLALLTLAGLMAIAGCGSADHSSTAGATRRPSTTGAQGQRAATAAEFAGAYVRFLDGAGTAAALPDATLSVRALAGQAGRVPAVRRRGTLVLAELRAAQGQPGSYVLAGSDAAHTFYATFTVSRQHGRWLVTGLTPPDFVQALAPPGPAAPATPPGSSAPEHAARAFLDGYLPWLYGQGPLRAIHDATANLVAGLQRRPPRVPLTMRSLHPKFAAIALQHHRGGWQALPNITDGRETYELVLTITQTPGRWLVSAVSNPR